MPPVGAARLPTAPAGRAATTSPTHPDTGVA